YDDLRYEISEVPHYPKQKLVSLKDFEEPEINVPVISFFSGAGGIDLGFEALGFKHTLLVEKIPLFCETLKHNRPHWNIYNGDVSDLEDMSKTITKHIGNIKQFNGVFIGGPPCQPFSIAANQ